MTNIGVIDDHPIIFDGISLMLGSVSSHFKFYPAFNAEQGLKMMESNNIDILFLDISLPDTNGIDLCKTIKDKWKDVKIIGISAQKESAIIAEFIKNGGNAFILKSADKADFEKCIHSVLKNELYLSEDIKASLLKELITPSQILKFPSITRRENEILELLIEGKTGPQISTLLFLSPHTIETHRKNLMQKFQVNNLQSLLAKLKQLGIIKN